MEPDEAAPDVTTSHGRRPANVSYMNAALVLFFLRLAHASCHLKSPLCQGSADIQRLMYFYTHTPPPSAALENVLLEVNQSACVFLKPTPVRKDGMMCSRDWINI